MFECDLINVAYFLKQNSVAAVIRNGLVSMQVELQNLFIH